eukprot:SAG11_NODE_21473_length_424_cov_1.178462_1_plen_29_part_10
MRCRVSCQRTFTRRRSRCEREDEAATIEM